jgi:hypothetical protein
VLECDALLLSVGLIPENELSLTAGVELDPLTGGPIVNEMMETNISGIFAGGNVVHVHDLVDGVTWEAERAGLGAAQYIMSGGTPIKERVRLIAGKNIRYVKPNKISGEKEVTLYMRVWEPGENVSLRVGNIISKPLQVVKPSEMLKVNLSNKELEKIKEVTDELTVNC